METMKIKSFSQYFLNPRHWAVLSLPLLLVFLAGLAFPPTHAAAGGDFLKEHNLKVVSLKFFEGPEAAPAHGARSYMAKFPQASTRYIFWELKLEASGKRAAAAPFAVETFWYEPGGQLIKQATEKFTLEKDHLRPWYSHAFGFPVPGQWKPGKYRVVLKIGGKEAASGEFEIAPGK
ncbi:MAG: hypothetical protein C4567_04330 [Deltaproteobacteria bacterium]|nr:MAG: hypothetical protein C4567_04330 [Deltaproteobacteria bacterium]